jgi:hypothetical protein
MTKYLADVAALSKVQYRVVINILFNAIYTSAKS